MGLPSKETDSTSHSEKYLFTSPIFHFSHIGAHLKCRLIVYSSFVRGNRYLPFSSCQKPVFSDGLLNNHLLASLFLLYIASTFQEMMSGFPNHTRLLVKHMHIYEWRMYFSLLLTTLSVYKTGSYIPQNLNAMMWHGAERSVDKWKLSDVFFRVWPQR